MSIPPADVLSAQLDRVLRDHESYSGVQLAKRLGVAESYVRKLRDGWRPSRVRDELALRLASLDPDGKGGREPSSVEFYDGVLFAAQAMSETVTRLLAEARAGLRTEAPPAKRHSPTAGEIAIGLEVLRAADAAQASSRRGKSG